MALFGNNSTTWEDMMEDSYENQISIPIFIILIFLMIFGIFGNSMVLYIYGLTLKKSNVQLFITALAFFDILGCFIAMPLDIAELIIVIMHTDETLCRNWRFPFIYFCNTSLLMFLLISIERHQDICYSTRTQLSRIYAKIMIFFVGIMALLMTLPMLFMSYPMIISHPRGDPRYTMDCKLRDNNMYLLGLMLLLIILIILIIICVLYQLVWKTTSHRFQQSDDGIQLAEDKAKSTTSYRRHNQTNRTLVAITVLYILSFVPVYFTAVLLEHGLSITVIRGLMFFFRMWALNFAMKPLVYVLYDEQFRKKLLGILHNFRAIITARS